MPQTTMAEPKPAGQDKAPEESKDRPSFKPVALPALAAAVQAIRPKPRQPRPTVLPPCLREDADLG